MHKSGRVSMLNYLGELSSTADYVIRGNKAYFLKEYS